MFQMLNVLLLTMVFGVIAQTTLPNLKSSCHRNDPERCIKNTMMKWKPYLAEGMPSIGVPRMEPIYIENLFDNEAVGVNRSVIMSVSNIKIYGCTQYIVRNLDISVEDRFLHYEAFFPNVYIDGQYSVSGKYIVPLSGSGQITANYTNAVGDVSIEWDIVRRQNRDYMKIKKVTTTVSQVTATNFFMEKFMHSDPGISGLIVVIINMMITNSVLFWNLISQDVIRAVEKKVSPMMMDVMNNVAKNVPYDDILLDY